MKGRNNHKNRKGEGAPAPYTKYKKKPHRYSKRYQEWRALIGRVLKKMS